MKGGARDLTFVSGGKEMLSASLPPKFFWKIEPALWLKAIYFDSGAVPTPQEAIAKAYEAMPGIESFSLMAHASSSSGRPVPNEKKLL